MNTAKRKTKWKYFVINEIDIEPDDMQAFASEKVAISKALEYAGESQDNTFLVIKVIGEARPRSAPPIFIRDKNT